MRYDKPKYCRSCGANLSDDSEFCEFCGSPIIRSDEIVDEPEPNEPTEQSSSLTFSSSPASTKDTIEFQGEAFVLPDPHLQPRIGRALSRAWETLNSDMGTGVIVTLLYGLVSSSIASLIPVLGFFGQTALFVGVYGWAEELRLGVRNNVGSLFRIGLNRFLDAVLLSLMLLLGALLWFGPFLIAYFGLFVSLIMGLISGIASSQGNTSQLSPFMITTPILFVFVITWIAAFALVISPILQSMVSMICWAIANGQTFTRSFNWAWDCVKKNFFGWWLTGIVLNLVGGVGVLLCWVGVLVTFPWSVLAWTEIISDTGND